MYPVVCAVLITMIIISLSYHGERISPFPMVLLTENVLLVKVVGRYILCQSVPLLVIQKIDLICPHTAQVSEFSDTYFLQDTFAELLHPADDTSAPVPIQLLMDSLDDDWIAADVEISQQQSSTNSRADDDADLSDALSLTSADNVLSPSSTEYSSSYVDDDRSEEDDDDDDYEPSSKVRRRVTKCSKMRPIDRRARKKQQNRESAFRYRLKKRSEEDALFVMLGGVEERNKALREDVRNLSDQIAMCRSLVSKATKK